MSDSNLKKEHFEENQSNFISIEEAKRYFSHLGSESIFMIIKGVKVPIYYNGLKIDLNPGWENNIGKYHPDAISIKLYGEAMDKYEKEFEPKVIN